MKNLIRKINLNDYIDISGDYIIKDLILEDITFSNKDIDRRLIFENCDLRNIKFSNCDLKYLKTSGCDVDFTMSNTDIDQLKLVGNSKLETNKKRNTLKLKLSNCDFDTDFDICRFSDVKLNVSNTDAKKCYLYCNESITSNISNSNISYGETVLNHFKETNLSNCNFMFARVEAFEKYRLNFGKPINSRNTRIYLDNYDLFSERISKKYGSNKASGDASISMTGNNIIGSSISITGNDVIISGDGEYDMTINGVRYTNKKGR